MSTPESRSIEGPLEHAARAAAEASYLARLDDRHREAWERAAGARPEETSKRVLVALSHTIEKAVMSGPIVEPTVVIAMFQRLEFFDREREVYERMAAVGVEVVVGFTRGEEPAPPAGVHVVTVAPDEALADEWTVVAVSPEAGAFLVATDQHRRDPDEPDGEGGRRFTGRWGYSRPQAAAELARLRLGIGDRLAPEARRVIDELLARAMPAGGTPASSAGSPGEVWATTSLHHMIDTVRSAHAGTRELREQLAEAHQAVTARAAAGTDPASGLSGPDFLGHWSTTAGTAPLGVGLALFDVTGLGAPDLADDERAAYHAAHHVAAALTRPLGPVDAAVRLSAREFLIVVPGASARHLAALCDAVSEQLELASHGYPGIPLRARIASTTTTARPLPVDDLRTALDRLPEDHDGPLEAGRTLDGERVVIASTRLHDAGGTLVDPSQPGGSHDVDEPAQPPDTSDGAPADRQRHAMRLVTDPARTGHPDPAAPSGVRDPSEPDETGLPTPRRMSPAELPGASSSAPRHDLAGPGLVTDFSGNHRL